MTTITDPVREFTDFCQTLRVPDTKTGGEFLAARFDVEPWSSDFFQILSSIHSRIEVLKSIISETDLDDDITQMALDNLETVRTAFSFNGLSNQWTHSVTNYLSDAALMPVRMASGYVRTQYGYTIPSEEELEEIAADVQQLLEWLRQTELTEQDFIRSALIEGLELFLMRLKRTGWYGWPETFSSLREVVAAYLALERGRPEANVAPPYEAMLKKVGSTLQTIFAKVKVAKDVQEVGDWVLRGYGVLYAVGHASKPLAGLLTQGPA